MTNWLPLDYTFYVHTTHQHISLLYLFQDVEAGNALERVQRVHEPGDLWDITFCTR